MVQYTGEGGRRVGGICWRTGWQSRAVETGLEGGGCRRVVGGGGGRIDV